MTEERSKQAAAHVRIGIAGHLALAVLKGTAGYLSQSKALIADALHSASDAFSSIAVLRPAAKRFSDGDLDYGQIKAISKGSILIAVLLLILGLETGISSIKSVYYGVDKAPEAFALIIIVISIAVKEALFQFKYRRDKKLSGHERTSGASKHRSDLYASIAAFIGVSGALLGYYLGNIALYYLDPLAGLVIGGLIVRTGYQLLIESIHDKHGHELHQEDSAEMLDTVQRVKGVITIDDLRAREHGHYVIVEIKISVNPRISIQEGHDIAKIIKFTLMKRFIHVSDVFVHVSPYDPGYPYKNHDLQADEMPTLLH
ncbi:cation diffusion facilitator family transporter [Paenibacillus naphthalenovorans]|uniref:cation diffusion facilitator family transporter n=1 Tax=Paenibacillus naphthalenovorans TaxID=162209 RepID=UPI003D271D5A